MVTLTPAVLTMTPGRLSVSEVLPQGGLVCNLNAQVFSGKLNAASHTDDMGSQVKTGNINSGIRCS
jgi:hypothetical protein